MRAGTVGAVTGIVVLAALAVGRAECPSGQLFVHHDGSFENGFSWTYYSSGAPYGCFGEGYDLGPGVINCAAYWIINGAGSWGGCLWDLYIWDGGITREPGYVIAAAPGVIFYNTPYWPDVGQNDHEMDVHVADEFTVGHFDTGQWDSYVYIAADCNGLGGHPWTCVPPGVDWPSGWQDPALVWGTTRSLGIGVYFTPDATPAEITTWGAVKSLFR
jgi:hypothetical protein